MDTTKTQRVDRLRRTFPNDWLLIEVDQFDSRTTTPLTGRLVAHSQLRDSLEKKAAHAKGLIYLVHGSDTLPRGYVAAF